MDQASPGDDDDGRFSQITRPPCSNHRRRQPPPPIPIPIVTATPPPSPTAMPANAPNARFVREYLGGQWFHQPPVPTKPFTNQTIIVTGANTGMGLEAARHFVRLDAAKVILAVRSLPKGQAAVDDIATTTKRPGVAEAWELDLASYASVEAFARRANALPRLDVVVANAGVFVYRFERAEGDELTVTVNVVSHMLLALLVLPKLRETAVATGRPATFTFTGSFTHWMTAFEERKEKDILAGLNDEGKAKMGQPSVFLVLSSLKLADPFC